MLISEPFAVPAEGVDAAKTWLRIDGDDDDSAIAAFVAAAIAQCEEFTRLTLIERAFTEAVDANSTWVRLSARPVLTITDVSDADGNALPVADRATDIDADGIGQVRSTTGSRRLQLHYQAGVATGWAAIPPLVRQGILHLAGHYHATRDQGGDPGLPPAVVALWRGARRMVLS